MSDNAFITVSQQKKILKRNKEFINDAKSMKYAYPNKYPYLSKNWLSSTENDTSYSNVINPQADTIYIVQNDNGKPRYPVIYDDNIRLYRLLEANTANDFIQRTLSDVEYTTIPYLYIAARTQQTSWPTHFSKEYKKGDIIRIYFNFNLYAYSPTTPNWLSRNQITVSVDGKSWNYQMDTYAAYTNPSRPKTFDQTLEISQDTTLIIQYYKYQTDYEFVISDGQVTEYSSHYNDYETDEWVPPTSASAGKSGKLPGIAAAADTSVFLSNGKWVTLAELKQMLDEFNNNDESSEEENSGE